MPRNGNTYAHVETCMDEQPPENLKQRSLCNMPKDHLGPHMFLVQKQDNTIHVAERWENKNHAAG